MNYKRITYTFLLLFLLATTSYGQDGQFTQIYATPLYQNPAMSGILHKSRLAANYRNQWSGVPAPFTSYNASFDTYLSKYQSGVGLLLHRTSNSSNWNTTSVSGSYAYHLRVSRQWAVSAGAQAAMSFRNLNISDLTYGYQYNGNGTYSPVADPVQSGNTSKQYFDGSLGAVLYSDKMWLGLAAHHLLRPDVGIDQSQKLPFRYSLNAGYQIPLEDMHRLKRNEELTRNLTFMAQFQHQGTANQLDLGAYIRYELLVTGLWYRGLPVLSKYQKINQDAIAAMLGMSFDGLTIGYSYDMSLSGITPLGGGSHEIGLVYVFGDGRAYRGPGLPCPKL